VRVVDAHQHFWEQAIFDGVKFSSEQEEAVMRHNRRPQDLRPLLDAEGVQGTVLVMDFPPALSTSYRALELAQANSWIAAVVGWVDLADPDVGGVLDSLCHFPKFKGVRHLWELESDADWILRPAVLRGLRALARRNLAFDLLAKPHNWPYISQVAAAIPDLRLVIDHIGKPVIRERQFCEWADMMRRAAEFPQVMAKLSGMITQADWEDWQPDDLRPYVTTTIELFGVDRVMFGSDWPVCLLAGSYGQVLAALRECLSDLTEAERSLVLGANAQRFYGIACVGGQEPDSQEKHE